MGMRDLIIFCNTGDFTQVLHSYLKAKRISPLEPLAKQRKNNLQRSFLVSLWSFSLSCFSIPGESGISSSIASSVSTVYDERFPKHIFILILL